MACTRHPVRTRSRPLGAPNAHASLRAAPPRTAPTGNPQAGRGFGLAMGFNEAAGYVAAATALATGYLAESYGLRPAPFFLGIAFAALGLGLSTLAVKETRGHARLEAASHVARADGRHDHLHGELSDRQVFTQTSFREPALSSASQAGLVNNLNDGLAWGLFPILFAGAGLSIARIGVLAALYPAVWGVAGHRGIVRPLGPQVDDRRRHVVAGLGLALIAVADAFAARAVAAVLLGAGTAMVYPTLLASIGDVAHPAWRARSIGIYRLWRDGGFAVAPCSPASSPTCSASAPPCGPSRA